MSPTRRLIPSEDQLLQRLSAVEAQITTLEAFLRRKGLTQAERAGGIAHLASLTQRRRWYVARIRSTKPVEALGVEVDDRITTREAHP